MLFHSATLSQRNFFSRCNILSIKSINKVEFIMNLFEFIIEFLIFYKISINDLDPKCYPDLIFFKFHICV